MLAGLPVVLALIFLTFTSLYVPFRVKIQFDGDEGLNLMRSMLVDMGHPLYLEVSSDQPPLFTHTLALLLRMVGYSVSPARFLVLLFSTLIIWSCTQFLQLTWSKLAAILFVPLIMVAPRYLVLSVSVMIGLPSLALAAVSMLFLTFWHKQKRSFWLVLSGFALALSVLIKLFSGFLAPIFLIGITADVYWHNRSKGLSWKILRPALLWGLCFSGLALMLGIALVGPQNLWQIIYPHLASVTDSAYQSDSYTINSHLKGAVPLLLLSLPGVFVIFYKRSWLNLYPLSWGVLAYVFLSFYSPVSYHHQLLITIPAAMIAAGGIATGLRFLVDGNGLSGFFRFKTLIGVGSLICFIFVLISLLPPVGALLSDRPRASETGLEGTAGKVKVISVMNNYAEKTNWIVTDMPMYAFIVKRPVPPILATFSRKRLETGSLTEDDVLTATREYNPEQVLMARFVIPGLENYLKGKYTLVASPEFFRLFVRNDLLKINK